MSETNMQIKKFHLKANASFTIREGWLTKGLRNVNLNPAVFLEDEATDILGIGSAMVKSLRFWMQATGLAYEPNAGKRTQRLTPIGQLIFENDLYFEDYFSLYLVHYHLVTNPSLATVWYLLFNHFDAQRFTKEDMSEALLHCFRPIAAKEFSVKSFQDDCSAALKTYASDEAKQLSPEENTLCPLTALDLFTRSTRKTYEKTIPPASKLHAQVVLYVLLDRMGERDSISLDKLLTEPCNIGKVFHLTPYRLNMYLDELQAAGELTIQRTAGLNMIYPTPGKSAMDVAVAYYRR